MQVITRLSHVGQWFMRAVAPLLLDSTSKLSLVVAETAWTECAVNLHVHRSFFYREVVPFRIRYRICHVATLIHTYLPRIKRIVELNEYGAFIAALAHMTDGEVVDHEPVLVVLAVVAEERFRVLYDRPAPFLHGEVIEPLALEVEGLAGERIPNHVVMLDEALFRSLEATPFSPEQVAVQV